VTLGTNPNYTVTKTDAVLTVTPKAVTVVADKSKVYGDVNPTYRNGNRCCRYGCNQLYPSNNCGNGSNVGTHPIAVTLGTKSNYTVTKTDAVLTVTHQKR
jgi:hypothetical protein